MAQMKQRVARLRASLKAAPGKEPKGSVKAIIAEMRADLVKARREKNWTFADLRAWLSQEGVEVTEGTLKKYLATPTKTARAPESTPVGKKPGTSQGQGGGATKPVLSMPRPVPKPKAPGTTEGSEGSQPPRASSFPIRRDRPEI